MNYLQTEFQRSGIFLLPIRIFMGLAWMRVGLTKLFDPQWHSGEVMRLFFQEQIQNGDIVFPFYESLIYSTFEPAAGLISGIILFAELYIGFAILFGCFTNLALIGGIFMNLNFMLAGSATPSVFYILIQAVLLGTNSGAVLGFDRAFSRRIRSWFLVAQPDYSLKRLAVHPLIFFVIAGATFALGIVSIVHIKDMSLNMPPDDPAFALGVLCLLSGIMFVILAIRSYSIYKGYIIHEGAGVSSSGAVSSVSKTALSGLSKYREAKYREVKSDIPIDTHLSVNDFATILVPHNLAPNNIVDTTARDMMKARKMTDIKMTAPNKSIERIYRHTPVHTISQSVENPPANALQHTINEMSTMLIPHNMSGKSVLEKDSSSNKLKKVFI